MLRSITSILLATAGLVASQAAPPPVVPPAVPPPAASPTVAAPPAAEGTSFVDLIGTWSSKSNSTLTGPNFYDPVNEVFKEPAHPGISYTFHKDGFFEEAYYRAVANPQNPKCPKGIIQWQHGKFEKFANGSLILTPFAVDGRQLYSDPCSYEHSIYTRYNVTEEFKQYEVIIDPYHKIRRLNLFKKDGAPLMPLYLAFAEPEMLPTSTLNPLTTATPSSKAKRSVEDLPLNHNVVDKRSVTKQRADTWWWFGVIMTASGGVLYFFF